MKDEQQRIAIAEAMRWNCDPVEAKGWGSRGQWVIRPDGDPSLHSKNSLPDYLNDLNSWVCLERGLSQGNRETYQEVLINICQCPFEAIHATAAQRAEAYLRTINKWSDEL